MRFSFWFLIVYIHKNLDLGTWVKSIYVSEGFDSFSSTLVPTTNLQTIITHFRWWKECVSNKTPDTSHGLANTSVYIYLISEKKKSFLVGLRKNTSLEST